MLEDFRLLVFDWDGTLMDSETRIVACMQAAIDDLRLPPRRVEDVRDIIGLGLREAVSRLYPEGTVAIHDGMIERYRHHFLVRNDTPSPLFDGVADMLAGLHRNGHLLAIATGKSRRGLEKALAETGCAALFDASRCADEAYSKPHPRMLQEIMDELRVPPAQTLMIGDTEYDLQMARNAGARALGVSYGVHAHDRLLRCDPLACLDSVAALRRWLGAG